MRTKGTAVRHQSSLCLYHAQTIPLHCGNAGFVLRKERLPILLPFVTNIRQHNTVNLILIPFSTRDFPRADQPDPSSTHSHTPLKFPAPLSLAYKERQTLQSTFSDTLNHGKSHHLDRNPRPPRPKRPRNRHRHRHRRGNSLHHRRGNSLHHGHG